MYVRMRKIIAYPFDVFPRSNICTRSFTRTHTHTRTHTPVHAGTPKSNPAKTKIKYF